MSRVSIWKRVGGWLHGSQEPLRHGTVEHVDADGMLVDPDLDDQATALASRPGRKDRQMQAMEEGFSRLVDVLESINDNVVLQRQQSAEMKDHLQVLSESMRALPATDQQAPIKELTEELRSQATRQQEVADVVSRLPDLTQIQLERLAEINRQLETSADADMRIAESFNKLDAAVQDVSGYSSEQADALRDLGSTTQQSNSRLMDMLHRQSRRMFWVVVVTLVLCLLALGAAVAALLLSGALTPPSA